MLRTRGSVPEIKRIFLQIREGRDFLFSNDEKFGVCIKSFQLQTVNICTPPEPSQLVFPGYPYEMIKGYRNGEAQVSLTVDKRGAVTAVRVKATEPEFEQVIKDTAPRWHFLPGIDRATRLPIETQVSLVVEFRAKEN